MKEPDIEFKDLVKILCRGAYPSDWDSEWDAETATFRRVIHVQQTDGAWRTYRVDSLRADPSATQPAATASSAEA